MDMVAVGISGATGCIYGIRLLEALRALGQETELILSDWGAETIRLETDLTVEQVKALADRVYDNRNMAAQAASGSSCADAMVIAPCSMKTLAGIAMGYDDSLLVRAADVMLKERRRLILLTRETPLNLFQFFFKVAINTCWMKPHHRKYKAGISVAERKHAIDGSRIYIGK
jgi:4-hydroxy-3-polyprenylbenzoate decarboxylase